MNVRVVIAVWMVILFLGGMVYSQTVTSDWSQPSGFQYAMPFYATVSDSFGGGINASNSFLAVLNKGVTVGLISMISGPAGPTFFGVVYGDQPTESGLTVLSFNGSNGTYSAITSPLAFNAGSSFGNISTPIALTSSQVIRPTGGSLLVPVSMTYPSITLTQDTVFDFKNTGLRLTFTGNLNDLAGHSLKIYDWKTGDAVNFTTGVNSGLMQNNLLDIQIYSDAGSTMIGTGLLAGNTLVVVPVPEPSIWLCVLGILGWMVVARIWPTLLRKRTS
jgi:hypothetical protein